MHCQTRKLYFLLFFLTGLSQVFLAQYHPHVKLDHTNEECNKASALIRIEGFGNRDSTQIIWSSGQTNVNTVENLDAGDYSVHVRFVFKDSLRHVKDTVINFTVEKELCPLLIPRYFSPNGDGYNDELSIIHIENYPEFEFIVYNKLGQRVHYQQRSYVPWDGKWLGTGLPDGTYYFVLFYNKKNTSEFVKGDLTILR
jgi:gliding motility-associated-like protein